MQTWNSILNGEKVHSLKVLYAEFSNMDGRGLLVFWSSWCETVTLPWLSEKLRIADRNGMASLWVSIFQSYYK